MNLAKLTVIAAGAAIVAFAGGYGAMTVSIKRQPIVQSPTTPAVIAIAPMIVPVWGQGHITGFVAVEMNLELAPGSDRDLLMPTLRDRLLGDLYDIGAQGGMQPGTVDPQGLQAQLLRAAGEVTSGSVRNLTLTKLILQENRHKPA